MQLHEPVPFRTNDAVLAFCLYLAGIPEFRAPTSTYDEGMLLARGYEGSGLTPEEAAKQEFAKKKRGHVEYWFQNTDMCKALQGIYREQQAEIANADEDPKDAGAVIRQIIAKVAGRDAVTNKPTEEMDELEGIVRIACLVLKARIAYVERSNAKDAAFLKINLQGESKAERNPDGSVTMIEPGFKWYPIFGSDELKRQLGVL